MAPRNPRRALELPPGKGNPRNSEGAFATLKDGRILFVYTHFVGGRGDHAAAHLAARYSSDNGRSWTESDRVIVPNEGGMNVMSVSLLRLQNNELALFYLCKNSEQDCRPLMRVSTDEGETWGDPVVCITDQVGYYVLNNDRAIQLANGRLVLPVALHWPQGAAAADWRGTLMCYLSDDNGRTWRRSQSVFQGFDEKSRRVYTQEPGVVELKDQRLLMFIRSEAGSQYLSWSEDGGETWSAPKASDIKAPCSPASIKRLPTTGDLLLVWNNHQGIPATLAKKRVPLSTAISRDDGRTWQHIKPLEGNPLGWYCYIAIHPAGEDVLLGYCAMSGLAHSRITRVPVEWLYRDAPVRITIEQNSTRMFPQIKAGPMERLESAVGVWSAAPGHAETLVYDRGQGIRIMGGEAREAVLTLHKEQPCGELFRHVGIERFTSRAPYELTVEAETATGWRTIYTQDGATQVVYPHQIMARPPELVTGKLRFRCTSVLGAIITDMPDENLHGYFND